MRYCEKESESTGFQVTSVFFQFCRIGILEAARKARQGLDPLANLGIKRSKKFFAARPLERRF